MVEEHIDIAIAADVHELDPRRAPPRVRRGVAQLAVEPAPPDVQEGHDPFVLLRAGLITSMAPGQAADPFDPNAPKAGDTTLIDAYLDKYPQNLEVLAYHLRKSSEAGDYTQMAELLAQTPVAAENDNRFWRYKGILHLERKELAPAKEAFDNALQVNPYDWTSRHQLATVLRLTGETKEAERQLELSRQGKEIERAIKRLANAADAATELLEQVAQYAAASGDRQVVAAQTPDYYRGSGGVTTANGAILGARTDYAGCIGYMQLGWTDCPALAGRPFGLLYGPFVKRNSDGGHCGSLSSCWDWGCNPSRVDTRPA